jgi:WD40 repeat protein
MILASDLPQLALWEIGESGLAAKGTLPAANSKSEGLVAAPQQALAIRSDGMQLASLDSEGRANVWNVGDGSLAFVAAPEAIPATTDAPATKPGAGGLEFSADGGKLLIGHGRRLQVIDAKTGRFLQGYDEPTEIACAAFAPDNTTLAVGRRSTQENAAQECAALRQFSLQRLIPAHAGQVAALAFTPDGAGLLSGGADHQVRLWNVADGAPLRSYPGSEAEVTSVAVTQDGERVLAGGLDKKIRIWPFALPATEGEPAAGVTPTATFELASTIHSISTSADNTRLAAATDDGVVSVLDLSTGVDLQRFSAAAQPALAVAFAPDSRALVSGGADNVATVWTMSLVRNIAAQAGPIHDLALAAGGSQAVTAGATGVQHWNLADGNLLRKFNAEEGEFLTVAVRGDNQQLIAADADNRLVFWNLAGGEPTAIVELAAAARLARYSPDNQKIVVACADDHLRFFNPTDGKPTYELTSDTPLAGLTFAADNRTVLTAGNELRQWLYASPTAIRTLTGHGGSVYSVTYSQDGRWIASTSADQTVRIWDASTGAQAKQLSGHQGGVYSASFSPDGALLVSCGADKSIRLWDTLGGRQLKQIPVSNDSLYSVTFFPDGKRVAAAGLERKLYFVDALTGKTETTLDKHSDYVYRVAFNRSGSRVLTCGYGGNIMIWNAANGQQLHEENVHQVSNFADFSPDGARVIVAGGDGKAYFLDLPANVK